MSPSLSQKDLRCLPKPSAMARRSLWRRRAIHHHIDNVQTAQIQEGRVFHSAKQNANERARNNTYGCNTIWRI
jgi:hypothetical protein